ncbi:MAG: hypothetical protein IKC59_07725 [Clostridia bacterium]|nr:hypothetical protein [Clostridia bacterium]
MEMNFTIPVNEAFEASAADKSCGCPLCALYRKLEEDELDIILGASMMEPDIRIKTNEAGFCRLHYDLMFTRKNRLGMALTLESHLDELRRQIRDGGLGGGQGSKPIKRIGELEGSCYVCTRINSNFEKMADTAVYLWDTDEAFQTKVKAQPYFCLPHYRKLLQYGQRRLGKKKQPEFAAALAAVVETYFDELREDVSWFCKKFDYRYQDEPWNNSKDAVERAFKFLRSDIHNS